MSIIWRVFRIFLKFGLGLGPRGFLGLLNGEGRGPLPHSETQHGSRYGTYRFETKKVSLYGEVKGSHYETIYAPI